MSSLQGALVAFVVAAAPFAVFGITSAFWAIIVGVLASCRVERSQIVDFWNKK